MDFVQIWHDDRYWSKNLLHTIRDPGDHPEVKVMDLEIGF